MTVILRTAANSAWWTGDPVKEQGSGWPQRIALFPLDYLSALNNDLTQSLVPIDPVDTTQIPWSHLDSMACQGHAYAPLPYLRASAAQRLKRSLGLSR